ncbi:MAG: Hint domain-containing protein [Pseudobdellovibrionaceae bacterium]|nr:Hint domain-containing protein [Pseudobdellovibrionaceae bacterium]
MKAFKKFALLLASISLHLVSATAEAQREHFEVESPCLMSGDLRCGGGGVFTQPTASYANPLHDPSNPIYNPVAEDGPRCRELQLPDGLCQQHNTDMKANQCAGIDDQVISLLNQKGLAAGCQFSGGKLKFAYTCICGCFAPDTKIDVFYKSTGHMDQIRAAELVRAKDVFDLSSLTSDASLSSLAFNASPIKGVSYGPTASPLLVIQTSDKRTLKLTTEHGVLLNSGIMVTALELKAGDSLITRDGSTVVITQIETESYTGSVYNVETSGQLDQEHIIVAEGILVGDLAWQNKLKDQLGAVAIRK